MQSSSSSSPAGQLLGSGRSEWASARFCYPKTSIDTQLVSGLPRGHTCVVALNKQTKKDPTTQSPDKIGVDLLGEIAKRHD